MSRPYNSKPHLVKIPGFLFVDGKPRWVASFRDRPGVEMALAPQTAYIKLMIHGWKQPRVAHSGHPVGK